MNTDGFYRLAWVNDIYILEYIKLWWMLPSDIYANNYFSYLTLKKSMIWYLFDIVR